MSKEMAINGSRGACGIRLKNLKSVGVTLVLLGAVITPASSRAADDPFEDLRHRVEQLEADNQQLRFALQSQPQQVPPPPIDRDEAQLEGLPPSPASTFDQNAQQRLSA